MANKDLTAASKAKKDEFYTEKQVIEDELKNYRAYFRGKVVLCNCDDPYESYFFKYFASKFNPLGLKKLISICYSGSPVSGKEVLFRWEDLGISHKDAYKIEISEVKDEDGDGREDLSDVKFLLQNEKNVITRLDTGDFRSEECKKILEQADVVVTNPPFSLFRDYMAQLMAYNKKFLIIGNMNAITYKEVFPLIKQNKIWLGPSITSGDRKFFVPDDYPLTAAGCGIEKDGDDKGRHFIRVKGVRWYTNLDHKRRHEKMILYKKYTPEEYPRYDNYDAINVNSTKDIPCDYFGAMGVPITFLDKYNPEQFEILNANDFRTNAPLKSTLLIKDKDGAINGKPTYARILIRRRQND